METNESNTILIERFKGSFFNEKGDLTDEATKIKLRVFMDSFDKWIQ